MAPSMAELLAALPQEEQFSERPVSDGRLQELFEQLSQRPVPVGSLERLWALGGLQAKLALAYLAYFVRTWFRSPDRKKRELMETNLRSALRTLETMGYLRGAVMKIGQAVATFPEMIPKEFADLLGTLHCEAPPMHYSLLREHLENELGRDPRDVFDSFETEAFAAASLGQVHRARLPSGTLVAVKVQYPGIGRTIRADMRNLRALLFPLRLSKDWDNLNEQFGEVQRMLESETDYEQEAESLREARRAFREEDDIVVPRVYEQYCSRRVLTMEYLEGDSFKAFLATDPSQRLRNQFGEHILRGSLRLLLGCRMLYSDFHPGNFLFLDDGRLGFIDFGGMRRFSDSEWQYLRQSYEALQSSDRGKTLAHIQRSLMFSDEEMESRRDEVSLIEDWVDFYWESLRSEGPFDFGNPDYFGRAIPLWKRAAEARIMRQQPVNVLMHRCNFELFGLLFQLRAQVDCRKIYDEEIKATGWLS